MTRARMLAILDGTDPATGRWIAVSLNVLILLSAISVALETVDSAVACCGAALTVFEAVVVAVFATEYVLRLWATPKPLSYAFSVAGIIDLLAFLPSLLFLAYDLRAIRVLRLLRLLRLAKLLRYAKAVDKLTNAFHRVREELVVVSLLALLVLYLSAVGIYHFEHRAQPEVFGSIPESLWWALATLTTVGYGDVYPVTAGGRVFTGLVLLVGLGVVAVPTGLIATALTVKEVEDAEEEQKTRAQDL